MESIGAIVFLSSSERPFLCVYKGWASECMKYLKGCIMNGGPLKGGSEQGESAN